MRHALTMPLTAVAMALMLAGCGSEPAAEKPADTVIAQVNEMTKPLPGLYETVVELKELTVPGIPADQVDMMNQQMGVKSSRTETTCLTKADTDQGFQTLVRKMGQMGQEADCAISKFDTSGRTLNAALSCTARTGAKMAMDVGGTVAPDRSDLTMTMKGSHHMLPGQEMTMVMHAVSRRVGDCPV